MNLHTTKNKYYKKISSKFGKRLLKANIPRDNSLWKPINYKLINLVHFIPGRHSRK